LKYFKDKRNEIVGENTISSERWTLVNVVLYIIGTIIILIAGLKNDPKAA
jgi:hypothetical protein